MKNILIIISFLFSVGVAASAQKHSIIVDAHKGISLIPSTTLYSVEEGKSFTLTFEVDSVWVGSDLHATVNGIDVTPTKTDDRSYSILLENVRQDATIALDLTSVQVSGSIHSRDGILGVEFPSMDNLYCFNIHIYQKRGEDLSLIDSRIVEPYPTINSRADENRVSLVIHSSKLEYGSEYVVIVEAFRYHGLDKIIILTATTPSFTLDGVLSIEEVKSATTRFHTGKGILYIQTEKFPQALKIYSSTGVLKIDDIIHSSEWSASLTAGIYFIHLNEETYKVVVK